MSDWRQPQWVVSRGEDARALSGARVTRTLLAMSLLILSAAAHAAGPQGPPKTSGRRVALTFDDIPGVAFPRGARCSGAKARQWNGKLITALKKQKVPALALVVDGNLCESERKHLSKIYGDWLAAGFELGNHTFSHRDFNRQPLEWFQEDIIRGEATIAPLLAAKGTRVRYFRHPMLRSGTELAKKRALEDFLHARGYTIAPVTIDNEEYIYAHAYVNALERGDQELQSRVVKDYIRHMEEMFAFNEKLSMETLGYEVPQILLLHMNALNADHIDKLLAMVRRRGYRFVTTAEALTDPAYAVRDTYIGPRGLSWLQRWAITKGAKPRPEPAASPWIAKLVAP